MGAKKKEIDYILAIYLILFIGLFILNYTEITPKPLATIVIIVIEAMAFLKAKEMKTTVESIQVFCLLGGMFTSVLIIYVNYMFGLIVLFSSLAIALICNLLIKIQNKHKNDKEDID